MRHPHDRRLRGAGALRRRRRRDARAQPGRAAAGARLRRRARRAAVQVVSEGGNPRARRRLAPARPVARATAGRSTCVIGTKFPSYFARHPNKVAWLIHQYRAAYELCGTEYSDFDHIEGDVGAPRDACIDLDTTMLGECRRVFTNAGNTAGRLAKFNGLDGRAAVSSASSGRSAARPATYGDYVLARRPAGDGEARAPGDRGDGPCRSAD